MIEVVAGPALPRALQGSLAPVVRAIGAAMGPDGRLALFDMGGRTGRATTGVAIARESCASGGLGGIAPTLLKEALVQVERDLGDGTARLAVMVGAALASGSKQVAAGIDAGHLADALLGLRGTLAAAVQAVSYRDFTDEAVARAAGAPEWLAPVLARAWQQSGPDGAVELSTLPGFGLEESAFSGFVFDALRLDGGNDKISLTQMDDVHIIAADDIISDFKSLTPVIEGFASKRKALLIVARDVTGPALTFLRRNREAGVLTVAVMKPLDAGPRAAEIIEDLAIATGAKLIADRSGQALSALKPSMLGRAASLHIAGNRVELRDAAGDAASMALRAGQLAAEILANRYLSLDREHAERRRARLLGQWIELRIGCGDRDTTDRALTNARKALASIRLARREGVIAGGGVGFDQIATALEAPDAPMPEQAARRVAKDALCAVGQQLRRNVGHEPSAPNAPGTSDLHDPASLSKALVDQALSVAAQLLRLSTAVVKL